MPGKLPPDSIADDDLEQVTGGVSAWKASGEQFAITANYKGASSESGFYNKSEFGMGGRKGPTGPVGGTFF